MLSTAAFYPLMMAPMALGALGCHFGFFSSLINGSQALALLAPSPSIYLAFGRALSSSPPVMNPCSGHKQGTVGRQDRMCHVANPKEILEERRQVGKKPTKM